MVALISGVTVGVDFGEVAKITRVNNTIKTITANDQ
jgi:hypothetical protein